MLILISVRYISRSNKHFCANTWKFIRAKISANKVSRCSGHLIILIGWWNRKQTVGQGALTCKKHRPKELLWYEKNRNRTARVWPWWLSLHAISDENNNSIAIFWTFFNNELPRKFSVTLLILFPNGQGFGAIISGEHSQSLNLIIMVPVCEFTVKIKSSIRILKWNKKNNNKKKGKIQW